MNQLLGTDSKQRWRMIPRLRSNPTQWLQILATIVFATALTVLLVLGMQRADELQAASSTLQLASELSARPQTIRTELTLIQRELETTAYLGDSLRTMSVLRLSSEQAFGSIRANLRSAGLTTDPDIASTLSVALSSWRGLDQKLEALNIEHAGELYTDTASGSDLSAAGQRMKGQIDEMLATQSQDMQPMSASLERLGVMLRTDVDESGRGLRSLLLGGTMVAAILLGLMLYYAWRWRQSAQAAATAERQVANILGTVREGLFLIGRDMRLGEICSDSLRELLRLSAPAGSHFRDVLQPLVDEKTLTAALKFLGLLWKEKVHEELIESVNPLSQIEVSFTNDRGGADVRYLAFSFRRVRTEGASDDSVLGVVADITDRVLLARELEQVRADSGSQATLLLQLMRVGPTQLQSFLSGADVALRKSNAMLTTPGIEQEDLKKKLNGVFRELHSMKGEAAALALTSLTQRIHAIEDMLQALRGKNPLSGNDFLPMVVKLDELIGQMAQIQAMQQRVASLRQPQRPAMRREAGEGEEADSHRITTVISEPVPLEPASGAVSVAPAPFDPLLDALRSLTQETARAQGRAVRLLTRGLEEVPAYYGSVVKSICIQMLRNSIAHGIEPPAQRAQHGKAEEGTVQIMFGADGNGDYQLTVEDDGHGLSYEEIVDRALRLGLLRPEQAMTLERVAVYRLIFLPGFSTTEQVSEHAGRGVGLDAVSALVREHGGKIGVSTLAGQYTRFRVLLPKIANLAAPSAA